MKPRFAISLLSVLSLSVAFVSCNSATGYNGQPSTDPSITAFPSNGTVLTYLYEGTDANGSAVQLTEQTTLSVAAPRFQASSISDTVRGVFTSRVDSFGILANGDLYFTCGCDTFPTWTHGVYGNNTYVDEE